MDAMLADTKELTRSSGFFSDGWMDGSGQKIARDRKHGFWAPKWWCGLVKEIPLFQGNLGW